MKFMRTSRLCLLALLTVAAPGAMLTAADLAVVQVPPAPSPQEVKAAKQAFDSGGIVEMKGGSTAGFEALLNVSMPQSDSRHRQPPPCIQAARKLPSGAVRTFIRTSRPFAVKNEATCEASFKKWVAKQGLLEGTDIPYWTDVEDFSLANAQTSPLGNEVSLDLSVYRANTIDPEWDYYLVLYTSTMIQNVGGGIFAYEKVQMQTDFNNGDAATVNSFGPPFSSTAISIGEDIPFDQNASGAYTAQVNAAPSSTNLYNNQALWTYKAGTFRTTSFAGQGAVIYQMPTGTSHFTISTNQYAWFDLKSGDIAMGTILVPISAPQVLLPQLTFAMQGTKSSFDVNLSPYLQTAVSGLPGWMPKESIQFTDANGNETQTPPLGSSSFTVSFNVPANPPCLGDGSCANPGTLTMQTVPAYAAPQTKPPVISSTTIELVTESPKAGVLIAGGQDWNGNVLNTADVWDSQTRQVTPLQGYMVQARDGHTATLIEPPTSCKQAGASCPTTGQVLIAGGFGANGQLLSSTELFDPTTGQFYPGPTMTSAHAQAVALQLQDGRILIIGGLDQPDSATSVVDIYDPTSNTFSSTPFFLTIPRWNFAATLLHDGSVLVQGGSNGPTEYDGPATGTAEMLDSCGSGFYPLTNGPVVGRQALSAAVLKNGQVFAVGGYNGNVDGGAALNETELFTPGSGTFSPVTPLKTGIRWASTVLQEDGKVAVIGGEDSPQLLSTFDPASLSFVGSYILGEARDFPTAVRLEGIGTADKGKILIAGGVIPNTGPSNGQLVEMYDPTTQKLDLSGAAKLSASRSQNTMTLYGQYAGSLPATQGCQ